jgi:hypothetical protein
MTYRSDICKCEFVGRISPPESEVGTLLSELYAASFNLSLLHLRFEFAAFAENGLKRKYVFLLGLRPKPPYFKSNAVILRPL